MNGVYDVNSVDEIASGMVGDGLKQSLEDKFNLHRA